MAGGSTPDPPYMHPSLWDAFEHRDSHHPHYNYNPLQSASSGSPPPNIHLSLCQAFPSYIRTPTWNWKVNHQLRDIRHHQTLVGTSHHGPSSYMFNEPSTQRQMPASNSSRNQSPSSYNMLNYNQSSYGHW